MSADDATQDTPESDSERGAVSRPSKQTNSVETGTADSADIEERVHERVTEFGEEYPDLADLPLSEEHGRKLRRIVTEAEWSDTWTDAPDPTEDSFQVTELDRRTAATWQDAVSAFLTAHTRYEGLMARFANRDGDEFEIPLVDAWGEEYSRKQYARALALQRQMAGGERPTGGEAVAVWSRPATAMITLTGSSVPESERIPPVQHLDALHDSFSYDGVRDALRNTIEYHLGLEADDWGYWLQAEPHGMGDAESDDEPGLNACYTHLHVGVYFDAAGLDLDRVESELSRVVEKHVDVCDNAGPDAHQDAISVNDDVENMGSYLAAYMGGYTEALLDKPIEYIAWGAIYWSAARRRTSRSVIVTEAISADACQQRAEHPDAGQAADHAEGVIWNEANGYDVVCSCCQSGWAIDQDRLDGPPEPSENAERLSTQEDSGASATEDGDDLVLGDALAMVSVGESPTRARIRSKIEEYQRSNKVDDVSIPQLLGRLDITPEEADFVRDLLNGEDGPMKRWKEREPETEWELEAIVDRDGEEHPASGGGVDMVSLHLPVKHVRESTRLRFDLEKGEKFRCGRCNVASHNPAFMSAHIASEHGIEKPEIADRVLVVEDYDENDRARMRHPDHCTA